MEWYEWVIPLGLGVLVFAVWVVDYEYYKRNKK